MSMEISSDILAVREKLMSVEISSAEHFNCADKCWWSFQRRKVAVEISSDIFAVRENVGENF